MKPTFLLLLLLQLTLLGCSDIAQNAIVPDDPTFDELVYQNCIAVRDAAEAYALENGDYRLLPCDDFDQFLPGAAPLINPATGQPTEPVSYEPSGIGSVSYRIYAEYNIDSEWQIVGYYIVGRGVYEDIVITNIDDPEIHIAREQAVVDNYTALIDAINRYISNNQGIYPADADELNERGLSIVDYLPDGQLLVNPYTNERTEPSDWSAYNATIPGQITYGRYDADGNGVNDGCHVEAVGSYAPYRMYDLDKGHWMDEEYVGLPVYCPRGD